MTRQNTITGAITRRDICEQGLISQRVYPVELTSAPARHIASFMPRLFHYIFRQIGIAMLLILGTLAAALWLTQSLRFLEIAVNGGAGLLEFIGLIILTLPRFLTVLLPIAAGIAVIFVYNKLLNDSELVVMRSAGLSQWRLALPGIAIAMVATVTLYALHTYANPMARWQFDQRQADLQTRFSDVLIRPGVFNNLGAAMTLYVRERAERGELQGLVFRDGRLPEKPITILAERGILTVGDQGPQVIVFNGLRQEPGETAGQLQQLYFDRYVIDLAIFDNRPAETLKGPSERTLPQLIWYDEPVGPETARRFQSEVHNQLSQPLYGLAIPLAILAVLLTGEFNRRGQAKRLWIAVGTLVVIQGAALGLNDFARRGDWAIVPMYVIPLGISLTAFGVLIRARRGYRSKAIPPAPPPEMAQEAEMPPGLRPVG